jgi:hypothetical protein
MAESIKTAVNAFYAEYSAYPSNSIGKTDTNFLALMTSTNSTGASAQNSRGIAFLEVPPKFTNENGLVTPKGFLKANRQDNFNLGIDTNGAGVQTNKVGTKNFVNAASVVVWVSDPSNTNKPVGTFK